MREMVRSFRGFLGILLLACLLSACAATAVRPPVVPPPELPRPVLPALRGDIFHIVAPGETLWRISKMYDVPAGEIVRANRLGSQTPVLQKGRRLFIPGAAPVMPVVSLYASKKWKYIIVHHSASDEGSSLSFDGFHQGRGWDGIGYHFVINNGTKGKADGQIEVSPRWLKQEDGAHCKADGMNRRGIGICLVGNFNSITPTDKQMEALVYLTKTLRQYYRIPFNNIMGHGAVPGANTECPGKRFPWNEFLRRLAQ